MLTVDSSHDRNGGGQMIAPMAGTDDEHQRETELRDHESRVSAEPSHSRCGAMRSVDPGFDPNDVLTMRMSVTGTKFETRDGIAELAREGLTRVQQVPGVVRASTTCCMPLETVWQLPFVIAGRAGDGLIKSGRMSFHGWAAGRLSRPDISTSFIFRFSAGETFRSTMTRERRAS